jgi:hypothetical protein
MLHIHVSRGEYLKPIFEWRWCFLLHFLKFGSENIPNTNANAL